ncbi:Putative Zinc finger, PHD-type, Zinc finger, FYVE/PHD-type, Zinc finger, RING/FYVE/PHD-type [Colletotrichum destructivum]|uniref:Zinc finger, PHD-type, Zinc finger, FYVE/PHD-type, Zinc finger, RING/FYVE/PHD-type n=1 Tax=Colletotrichum destructivum TaxID=34406 RepID=A0AAX4HXQ1_9PEZI|nr:Putative Zinc finger, PHD-type, Zinc finger, FYVE/PHD-type, Zinc finger, RING/FYVE/PHD-type [Colletotrichum destructivum]
MSGDQLASSFGNPNAQPPTPKQTPISAVFPSPVFETPKQPQGHFDDAAGWTPRFAEEYSVFNTTPGNLRASPRPFPDFSHTTTSYPSEATLKRPLSAESLAAQIATHANHFSPNPNLSLPPVAPARRLPSSPNPPNEQTEFSGREDAVVSPEPVSQDRPPEEPKGREGAADPNGQTATPPPSSHKGGRKLAQRLHAANMQNDHGYGQPDFSGTPHHPNLAAAFVNGTDMFGFPMSAPANASASFWDPSADMSGMDIDFSFGPNVFQTSGHRHMPSFDASQMFQEASALPPSNGQETSQPIKRTRPLAPKPAVHHVPSSSTDISMASVSFVDDPFGIVSPGGVNPGLLFGRPSSSGMASGIPVQQGSAQFALAAAAEYQSRAPMHSDVRRSLSTKELGSENRTGGNAYVNPSAKPNGRPSGLQRSISENRGRRGLAKATLPKLAPAIQPRPQVTNGPAVGSSRPPSRPSGRISPLKQQQQSRLSSLTSIPEAVTPRMRTAVKFTIDSKGRARAETTVVTDDSRSDSPHRKPAVAREMPRRERSWESDDDDESSTDDEPIIIPSRNASFALPDPRRTSSASVFQSSRRSVSEHSSSSFGATTSQHDQNESEAETVMNEGQAKGGDAASELRKLVENRNKRAPLALPSQRSQRFASGSFQDPHGGLMSPTAFTEVSLPSPTKATYNVRCVCRNGADKQGEYMVQCESCEMWLHGSCINISRRTLPTVYICAFCSNTPHMRGGRLRSTGPTLGSSGASPLTRKSFR